MSRDTMGIMTDTKPREDTAVATARALVKSGYLSQQFASRLRLWGDHGHVKIVAVLREETMAEERAYVCKYRANSGRWTKPQWVPASELRAPDVKEKRYRDALASLVWA